jgi:uncharacterized membrane protein YbhN (UPF0104 family)
MRNDEGYIPPSPYILYPFLTILLRYFLCLRSFVPSGVFYARLTLFFVLQTTWGRCSVIVIPSKIESLLILILFLKQRMNFQQFNKIHAPTPTTYPIDDILKTNQIDASKGCECS